MENKIKMTRDTRFLPDSVDIHFCCV